MPDDSKPITNRSYVMGDVGQGARAMQGDNNSWVEGITDLPEGVSLKQQFDALLKRISEDTSLDQDERELAQSKIKAVADALVKTSETPGALRIALKDAKNWFGNSASWIGGVLGAILKGDPAQETIGNIADETVKSIIESFTV